MKISAKCGECGKYFDNVDVVIFLKHLEYEHGWNIEVDSNDRQ